MPKHLCDYGQIMNYFMLVKDASDLSKRSLTVNESTSYNNENEQQTKPKSTVTPSNETTQIINNIEYVFVKDVRETEKIKELEKQNKKLNDQLQEATTSSTLIDLVDTTTTKIKMKKPKCDICKQELDLSFQQVLKHMDQCNELRSLFSCEK